jgi:hypothetical protein
MATSLKRIEKEFVLGSVRDDKARLLLIAGTGEWPVTITEMSSDGLVLSHAMPLRLLRKGQVYEFRFVWRDQPMAFRAKAIEMKESMLSVQMPEIVYKNLGRRYTRRAPPGKLAVSFSFRGDRFDLAFPVTREFDPVAEPQASKTFKPGDIRNLVKDFEQRSGEFASERAIRMFKDRRPDTFEERLIVRTGKIYYLPSAAGGLPIVDPYVRQRFATRDTFADFFREQGVHEDFIEEEIKNFERNKKNSGILSELMVPVIFQEYVIGYVTLVNKQAGKPPFDLAVLETFHQFAKILAYSLKINGYFKDAPKKASDLPANVLDISAGGLLFTNSSRELAASLLPGSDIDLAIKVGDRQVKARATVKRTYRDAELVYYGIEYEEFAPEDFRFLFESLYGRDFKDSDATGVEGLGVKMPVKFD